MKNLFTALLLVIIVTPAIAQRTGSFNGLDMNLGNLYRTSDAKTRSISPENLTGEPGKGATTELEKGSAKDAARELGKGWKVNPFMVIQPGQTLTLAEITGSGAIQHIWMTPTGNWRFTILRFYWDDETEPSVEVPVGDFFGMGWGVYAPLNSMPVTVNPGSAFNCYWTCLFIKSAGSPCRTSLPNA